MNTKDQFTCLKQRLNSWQFSKLWPLESFDNKSQERVIMARIPNYDEYLAKKAKTEEAKANAPLEFLFMYAEPILDKEQEQHLFRKYNFLKYKYIKLAQNQHLRDNELANAVRRLEHYYMQMGETKQKLVCANARLVMNLSKKANTPHLETSLSDGYLGLTMGVDYFDYRRGIKFITYAYNVIKDFIYKGRLAENKLGSFTNYDEAMEWELTDDEALSEDNAVLNERTQRVKDNLQYIPQREREVISYYYGLIDGKVHTLDEIGQMLRISKERVRQIKVAGLERMKRLAITI